MEKTKVETSAGTALKAGVFGTIGVGVASVIITLAIALLLCICCTIPSLMSSAQ